MFLDFRYIKYVSVGAKLLVATFFQSATKNLSDIYYRRKDPAYIYHPRSYNHDFNPANLIFGIHL